MTDARPRQVYTKLVPDAEELRTTPAPRESPSLEPEVHSHEIVTEAPVAPISEEPDVTMEEKERRAIDTLTFMLQNRSSGL